MRFEDSSTIPAVYRRTQAPKLLQLQRLRGRDGLEHKCGHIVEGPAKSSRLEMTVPPKGKASTQNRTAHLRAVIIPPPCSCSVLYFASFLDRNIGQPRTARCFTEDAAEHQLGDIMTQPFLRAGAGTCILLMTFADRVPV